MHSSPVHVLNLADVDTISPRLATMKLEHTESSCIRSLLQSVDLHSYGCVVANLHHYGIGGIDILQELNRRESTLPLVLIAQEVSVRLVVRVMRAGALTLLEEPVEDDVLFFALREALEENERRVLEYRETERTKSQFEDIVGTEFEVLDAVCDGRTNKQIADSLQVSVRTVEARKKRLLGKTGCQSQPELIIAYHRLKSIRSKHSQSQSSVFGDPSHHQPLSGLSYLGKSA